MQLITYSVTLKSLLIAAISPLNNRNYYFIQTIQKLIMQHLLTVIAVLFKTEEVLYFCNSYK